MGFQDLIVTPIYLLLFTALALYIRPYVTTPETRKYFLPALWARFLGAILLGIVYQFYYGGGDTFNFWIHGSQWIYEAFLDDPVLGLRLLFDSGGEVLFDDSYEYTQNIWYYEYDNSYIIVRIAAFFDILSFGTYSTTALFFAIFSFSGQWAFYTVIIKKYSTGNTRFLAFGLLFFPSVVFWGSGILKDTVTLGSLCWLTYSLLQIIEFKRIKVSYLLIAFLNAYLIYTIKIYILICYIPMVGFWIYLKNLERIKNVVLKTVIAPVLFAIFLTSAFLATNQVVSDNSNYNFNNLALRAQITAYDIRYGWGTTVDGQGGYDIGLPDGTISGTLKLAPKAINVSLFRPYIWEVKNPLMALAALESLILLLLTLWVLFRVKWNHLFKDPFLIFCLAFALLFAFAVGVSAFNFGTLIRYKIPMLPFLMIFLSQKIRPRTPNALDAL